MAHGPSDDKAPQPAATVCVIAYNSGPTLRACLEHLAAQTFRDFETLVIDNASPDFLRQLASDQRRQDARFATSHQVPVAGESTTTATAAGSWQPQWRSPQK